MRYTGNSRKNRWNGNVTTNKCDVRLTSEENSMLNELANKNQVSRSDVVRRALRDFYNFNTTEEDEETND